MSDRDHEKHKYVAKIELKGSTSKKPKYRYFYTKEEYAAYLKDKKSKEDNTKKGKTSKQISSKSKSSKKKKQSFEGKLSNLLDSGQKSIEKLLKTAKKNIDDVSKDVSKSTNKIVNKLEENVDKVTKNISIGAKEVKKSMKKVGSNSVDTLETIKDRVINIGKTSAAMLLSQLGNATIYNTAMEKINKAIQPIKDFDDLKKKPKSVKKQTDEEDAAEINQNYKTGMYEYTHNCAYCTMAYEMRQRGYDVEANPIGFPNGTTIDEIMSWYDDADPHTVSKQNAQINLTDGVSYTEAMTTQLEYELETYPEGSRGQFVLYWEGGGAHSVVWEIYDGNAVLRDCQSNRTLDIKEYVQYASDVTYFRTDNLELTDKALKCVRNR